MSNEKRLVADARLESDLNKAQSFDDIRALLESSLERSNIAHRNPITGRYESTESAQTASIQQSTTQQAETREFKKTIEIAGQVFEFTSDTPEGLDLQIQSAQTVAAELLRAASQENQEALQAAQRAEASLRLRRGETTAEEYLAQSAGVSVEDIARTVQDHNSQEYMQSWSDAVQAFLDGPGADYPGGNKNMQLMQMTVAKLGLEDAEDKVAALAAAFADMKKNGLVQPNDSDEMVMREVEKMDPREILELYKQGFQDAETANDHFVRSLSSSGSGIARRGSSGIFGK